MFERILLPLDGSGDWEALLPHLERLAAPPNSEVIVLEAVPFLGTLLEMPKSLGGLELGHSGDVNVAERYVSAVAGVLRSRGIVAHGLTEVGSASATIAKVARHLKATLVALAIQERHGLLRSFGRTPAEQALAACPTPMYVIPARPAKRETPPPAPYARIVVPLDGSEGSLDVIPAAAAFSRRFSAPLLFVHVVPDKPKAASSSGVFPPALRRAEHEEVAAETLLGSGDPASEILRICSELGGSLIAMRTHLTAAEAGGPLGSVTVHVLRAARVPMLIVHRQSETAARKRPAS
jgi:nucleotide-binding universal stress UspA family protein